jgi:hypothetical protein
MAGAAPAIGLAATGLSAAGALTGGMTASQGDKLEAQNATNAAQIGQTKAAETDADMRRKLTSQLANISAIRGGAGLNPNSPTGAAIEANVSGVSGQSRTQAVENIQNQSEMDQQAAQFYTSSASSALMGGELGAAGSIFKGLAGALGGGNNAIDGPAGNNIFTGLLNIGSSGPVARAPI